MNETKEISALFSLIDDPDEEVFSTVSERIVHYGAGIIPNLENLWENTPSNDIQGRIEMLIHKLQFADLTNDLTEWRDSAYHDLLFGALIVGKFQYPELQTAPVIHEIENIRRNIWLELNSFLTPLEQAHVVSNILYNYYKLKGTETAYLNADDFFLHKVLQGKKGNAISNGILYIILADLLDIPVRAINIPRQFVLAYFGTDTDPLNIHDNPQSKILFYVDATTGHHFTHKEIEQYFKRIAVPPVPSYFKPMSKKRIVQLLLEELSKCFDSFEHEYKKKELLRLADLLDR
ncbi:transglutaminase family protein [Panacibacter sp. DH6]|uniref:Transglutaminase family protein n=1 Tax=Panacibacter microcysteis TaxID=2793269 RepID=A0A931GZR4_9BACT|nr:transglutaminase family protein [Panacibacter microcysteis]MBG9378361.1 transglutaminase family protein [Panacibacter microcysteis]